MSCDKKDGAPPLTVAVGRGQMLLSSRDLFAVDQLLSVHQRLHVVDDERLWWRQKKSVELKTASGEKERNGDRLNDRKDTHEALTTNRFLLVVS